jgi:galactoside O-acetyltransferase
LIQSPYYSREELFEAGFQSLGSPLWVSRKASLYAIEGSLGDHVRIDDFCILKGRIEIGSYVHVAAFCSLSGVAGTLRLGDCASLGNRCSLYTGSDDYRADALASNLVPQELVKTLKGDVTLGTAALVGAHCVLLPGVKVGEAASVGAQCLLSGSVDPGLILVSAGARSIPVGRRDVARILELARSALERARENA